MAAPTYDERRLDLRLSAPPFEEFGLARAIIHAPYPIELEGMARVVAGAGIGDVRLVACLDQVAAAIDDHGANLLVADPGDGQSIPALLEVVRSCLASRPRLHVIMIGADDARHLIDEAFDAGVSAYVLRTAAPGDLAAAVRQAFKASIFLPTIPDADSARPGDLVEPAQFDRVSGAGGSVSGLRSAGTPAIGATRPEGDPVRAAGLTRRELEILRLVASGRSNGELARLLWVTEQTVKFHLSNTYRKLNVSNRTEAARWAQLQGLLDAGDETLATVTPLIRAR